MFIGVASGFFNPLHAGHVDYLEYAASRCDMLIVIVNNDLQVSLKGSVPFLDQNERMKIVAALHAVNEVVLSIDTDSSVSKTLRMIADDKCLPMRFFNSGDRSPDNQSSKEDEVCRELGIEQVFLDLPKVNSSSSIKTKIAQSFDRAIL
jgi:cytidyltransferase-like protein